MDKDKLKNHFKDLARKKRINKYYKKKYWKKQQIKNFIKLSKTSLEYRILRSLSVRACKELKDKKDKLNLTHIELIGCSIEKLMIHLEAQFTNGMTCENYGEWEIDHIKPVSSFDLSKVDEIKKCFNYQNLQPLWMHDNRSKSNKLNKR